jgi:nicotinamide-nucleotide amidase
MRMVAPAPTNVVIELLIQRQETVAIAESLTAGGLGHALTQIPGASEVFLGGVIAYTTEVKINVLGVSEVSIAKDSVVSEKVAVEMAHGARRTCGATWGIATTGIAGPGDYQGIPAGTVWIAIVGPSTETLHLQLGGGREQVREGAISSAIATFARILSARD